MNKLTNKQKESIIEVYTKVHNVSMLALDKTLEGYSENIMKDNDIENIKMSLKCFVYDLNSVYDVMQENMGLLWELRDKG